MTPIGPIAVPQFHGHSRTLAAAQNFDGQLDLDEVVEFLPMAAHHDAACRLPGRVVARSIDGDHGWMPASNSVQIQLIADMTSALDAEGLGWWLFGGWGLDAQLGRITREHGDVECWVERPDADAVCDALLSIGADIVDSEPPEESRRFVRSGVIFSSAFFDRNDDGSFGVQGRWSDWVFPLGSFGDSVGELEGMVVPAMSAEGMLAMKEQYANLRNGAPLRDKDVGDIRALNKLVDRPQSDDR